MRASILSVLASWPVPSANLRTRAGLTMDAGTPSASKAFMRGAFEPACGLQVDAFHVLGLKTARQRGAAVSVVAHPNRGSGDACDVQLLLAVIRTNPRA